MADQKVVPELNLLTTYYLFQMSRGLDYWMKLKTFYIKQDQRLPVSRIVGGLDDRRI